MHRKPQKIAISITKEIRVTVVLYSKLKTVQSVSCFCTNFVMFAYLLIFDQN